MEKISQERVNKHQNIILLLILLLGGLLRFTLLSKLPAGFHSQEALIGYRSYLLLNTGKDEIGRNLPLIFTSFYGYQLPVQTYITSLSVGIFGLSKFSVRFPEAFFGSFALLAIYGLAQIIFSRKIALWTAFLAAVSPWTVFASHVAFHQGLSFSFFIIGLYFLVRKKNKVFDICLSTIFFILSLYCTETTWFIIFPLFVFLIFIKNDVFNKKKVKIVLMIVLILFLPLLISYSKLPSFKQSLINSNFSLFTDVGIQNGINSMRGDELKSGNPIIGKIFYNKLFWASKYIEKYLGQYSPYYYFAKGDQNVLNGLWNFGPVCLIFIVPGIYGLIQILRKKDKKSMLLFIWFTIAVFIPAFAKSSPDQSRLIYTCPVVFMIIAYGMVNIKNKLIISALSILIIINLLVVYYDAVFKEPLREQDIFYYNFDNISQELKDVMGNYDTIYLSDGYTPDPMPLFLFYSKYPAEKYFERNSGNKISYHNWINKLNKITVGDFNNFSVLPEEKVLYFATDYEVNNRLNQYIYIKNKNESDNPCYRIEKVFNNLSGQVVMNKIIGNNNCILKKNE